MVKAVLYHTYIQIIRLLFKLYHFLQSPLEGILNHFLEIAILKTPEHMFNKDKKVCFYKTYVLEFSKSHFLKKRYVYIYTLKYLN